MLKWIAAIALTAFATALLLFAFAPDRPVLAAHVVFALGILPLIFGAMSFFVPVLTRSRAPAQAVRALPLAALAAGALAVANFGWAAPSIEAAAGLALAATLGLTGWIAWRAHRAVGGAHPGLHWYTAALVSLALALAAVLAMPLLPDARLTLRSLHLHLNALGFAALTAVGTLTVLMPTVTGRADPGAARRLRLDLPWAFAGTLLVAFAVLDHRLGYAGGALWLVVLVRLAAAWWRLYRDEILARQHPAAALAGAWLGLVLLWFAGVLHNAGIGAARDAVPAFVLAFLLPLVTGALSHLLPLWLQPQTPGDRHAAVRGTLARHSALRAALFVAAGLAVLAGQRAGILLAALGLALFARQLWRGLRRAPR